MGFLRWPWSRDEHAESVRTSPQAVSASPKVPQLSDRDEAVLSALISAGADLSQPRHVLYFLYFTSEAEAAAAASEAREAGFLGELGAPPAEHPDQWSVICERQGVVVSSATVESNTEFFERLASAHNGEFDGWEAASV